MNYALLGLHKVTQWTLTSLFSHLAQLLDEMTDLISFQIVLERVSLFHPLASNQMTGLGKCINYDWFRVSMGWLFLEFYSLARTFWPVSGHPAN